MSSYSALRKALLDTGLNQGGFAAESSYLVRDTGDCIWGIELQKHKNDPDQFFVVVGILSKRIDDFTSRFSINDRSHLYDWPRAQILITLASTESDNGYGGWKLRRTRPVSELAARLAPLILSDGIKFFEKFGSDGKLRDGFLQPPKRGKYSFSQGVCWPPRHVALVYAAILINHIGPESRFSQTVLDARSAAATPMERDWVNKYVDEIDKVPIAPEDMSRSEALDRLRELTGKDFGNDYVSWNDWLQTHPGLIGTDAELVRDPGPSPQPSPRSTGARE